MKIINKRYNVLGLTTGFLLFMPFYFALAVVQTGIQNPLGATANSLPKLIEVFIQNVVVPIGVPIATIFLIYSGFLFVKAGGKPEKITEAKETFLWVVIGTAILLGAWVLSKAIQATVVQLGTGVN